MASIRTSLFTTTCLVVALTTGVTAQDAVPTDGMLKAQIRLRESRVVAKQELLKTTDARLEKGIGDLVALLQAANDSAESRTRVTILKEQVAKALAKSIGYYRKKREETRAALQRPDLDYEPEDLRRGLAALDERIEKRIAQIVDLTRSLEVHADFEKYLVEYDDDDYGWDDDKNYRRNPDWSQNRRVLAHTEKDRKQVEEALTKNIEDLDRRERDLKSRLTNATGVTKDLLEEDMADVRRQRGNRTHQLSELKVPTASAAVTVDLERARELQELVKDMSDDLREDFFAIFRLYNELLVERRDVARLKEKVAK
ncbi:MAG: hypothetical protein ACKV19_13250 [Verrucomicrobiales bacterium]